MVKWSHETRPTRLTAHSRLARPAVRSLGLLLCASLALGPGAAQAEGLLEKLAQKLKPGVAEGDIGSALTLPLFWKLVEGPTQRGLNGVKSAAPAMPAMKLPFRVASGLPTAEDWVQLLRLAEPFAPRNDQTVNELFAQWRKTVLSLPAKATPADLETQAALRAKRLQVFTLADVGATPGDGRREEAVRRYQVIARVLAKSAYFSALAEADGLQQELAYNLEQQIALAAQMSPDQPAQLKAAQETAYRAMVGASYVAPTPAEKLQYSALLAVLNAEGAANADKVAAEYRGKLGALQVGADSEKRQLAPYVSEQRTLEVLKWLVSVDAELQRSYDAWLERPSRRADDLWHLVPYCLSQMPPPDVLRRNLDVALDFDRSYRAGTQPMTARLRSTLATVPLQLPAQASAMLKRLREQRERLSLAFLHYTAAYAKSESDRPDPALVAFYKSWVDRVPSVVPPELANACIDWRAAQYQVSDARWNTRSYAARDVWKPSAVSVMLGATDVATAEASSLVLRANAESFGDLVASQPAWRANERQSVTAARNRLGTAIDTYVTQEVDGDRANCEARRDRAGPNDLDRFEDCEGKYPRNRR